MKSINRERGATLIEILITVLILAVGLLGLASTQMLSMRNGNSANQRYFASLAAYDIVERMRANPGGDYNNLDVKGDETKPENNCAAACSAGDLKAWDAWEWGQFLADNLPPPEDESVSLGTTSINAAANTVTITISWSEQHTGKNYGNVGAEISTFTLVTEL